MQDNQIEITKNIYFYALECLGRLLKQHQLNMSFNNHLNLDLNTLDEQLKFVLAKAEENVSTV